jgi:hypothetical protein
MMRGAISPLQVPLLRLPLPTPSAIPGNLFPATSLHCGGEEASGQPVRSAACFTHHDPMAINQHRDEIYRQLDVKPRRGLPPSW